MYRDTMSSKHKPGTSGQIDENLRRIYDETLNEDVPDRFRDLLEKLRQKTAGSATADPNAPESHRPGSEGLQ